MYLLILFLSFSFSDEKIPLPDWKNFSNNKIIEIRDIPNKEAAKAYLKALYERVKVVSDEYLKESVEHHNVPGAYVHIESRNFSALRYFLEHIQSLDPYEKDKCKNILHQAEYYINVQESRTKVARIGLDLVYKLCPSLEESYTSSSDKGQRKPSAKEK